MFSVISSSSASAGRPVSRIASSMSFNNDSPCSCDGNRLMARRLSGRPKPRHAAIFSHAVWMIHRPIWGAIALSASASMNVPGARMPRSGCCHRSKASAPTTALSASRTCGVKKAAGAASIGFRLIKRKVGVREQFINVQSIIGGNGHPSTASKVEGVITDLEGFRQPFEHLADNLTDHAWITAIGNDHDKLIATKAEHLMRFVASFAELKQTLGDVNKQLVAARVTERVVHVLEAVKVEYREGS